MQTGEVAARAGVNIQTLRYYERRGLLHPYIDYEAAPAWLHQRDDPMDEQGYVHVSQSPGLGQTINFDYIADQLVTTY